MYKCFFIAPIGKSNTPTRKRSDQLVEIIQNVINPFDFELIRADSYDRTGNIPDQIINLLIKSELVIVDLTDQNANVFYELGIRHSTGLPIISIIQNGQRIPFDVGQERAIMYDLDTEQSISDFELNLEKMLVNSIKNPNESYNPVSRLEDFIPMKSDPFPNEFRLIQIINKLTKAYSLIGSFDNKQKHAIGVNSINIIRKLSPLILNSIDNQLTKLLYGTVETNGTLNNNVFNIMMKNVNTFFRAISVNDLDYWNTVEGEKYIKYITDKIDRLNIKAERIFILNSFEDLLNCPKGKTENYFHTVLLDQVKKGISIRIAYTKNVRLVTSIVKELDFGLFDDFAVSFFRIADGRTHTVDFTKDKYYKYADLYDKVKLLCEENQMIKIGDSKVFKNASDLKVWFENEQER